MTILEGTIHGNYIVQDIAIEENILRRLEALGIIPGTRLMVLNRKKNGTSIIKVRGTRWAIGREIAGGILVEEAAGGQEQGSGQEEPVEKVQKDAGTGGGQDE